MEKNLDKLMKECEDALNRAQSEITQKKIDRIKEEILAVLFRNSPKAMFTVDIAENLARDEEFVKRILLQLEEKNLIASVKKNPNGVDYKRRIRWRLSSSTFQAYQKVYKQNIYAQNVNYDDKEHTFS